MVLGRILPRFCRYFCSLDPTWLWGFFPVGSVRFAGLGDSDLGWQESSGEAGYVDI